MALLLGFYGEKGGKGLLKRELNKLAVTEKEMEGDTGFEPATSTSPEPVFERLSF